MFSFNEFCQSVVSPITAVDVSAVIVQVRFPERSCAPAEDERGAFAAIVSVRVFGT
jgi:hypothetical protein